MNKTTGRRRYRVRAEKMPTPNGGVAAGLPVVGEIITREDGASFTVLSVEPDGDRHIVMVLEATARA